MAYLRRAVRNNGLTLQVRNQRERPLEDRQDDAHDVNTSLERLAHKRAPASGQPNGDQPDGELRGREVIELFERLVDTCTSRMRESFREGFRASLAQMQRIARGELDNQTLVAELKRTEGSGAPNLTALQNRHRNARNRLLVGITQWLKESRIDAVEASALRDVVERLRQRR